MKSTKTGKLGKLPPRFQLSWSPKAQDPHKSFSKPREAASHKPLPSTVCGFGRHPPSKRSSKFSQLPDAIRFFYCLLKGSNNTGKKTAEFSLGTHNAMQKGLEHARLSVQTVYQLFLYLNFQTATTPRSVWQIDPENILFLFNPGESTDPFKSIPHKTGWPLKDHLGNHVNTRTCWASESHFHIISHHRKIPQPVINHAQDSGVTYHRAKKFPAS